MNKNEFDQAIREQIVATKYGVEESYSTTLINLEVVGPDGEEIYITPPPNLRLIMTNKPVMEHRERRGRNGETVRVPTKPSTIDTEELVRIQMAMELKEYGGLRRAALPQETQDELSYYEGLRVLEFQASVEVNYGRDDYLTAEEALVCPELRYAGDVVEGLIRDGFMDVVVADAERPGKTLNTKRPHKITIPLWQLRRIAAKKGLGSSHPEDLGDCGYGTSFFILSGIKDQRHLGSGEHRTHVIVGRMPDQGARPRRNLKDRPGSRLGQAKRGQPRRGWVLVLRHCDVEHIDSTYQDCLLPQRVPVEDTEGNETLRVDKSLHLSWLRNHPVDERDPVVEYLNSAAEEEASLEGTCAPEVNDDSDADLLAAVAAVSETTPVTETQPEAKPEAADTIDDLGADLLAAVAAVNALTQPEAKPEVAPAAPAKAKKRAPRAKKAKPEAAPEAAPADAASPATTPTPTPAPEATPTA